MKINFHSLAWREEDGLTRKSIVILLNVLKRSLPTFKATELTKRSPLSLSLSLRIELRVNYRW